MEVCKDAISNAAQLGRLDFVSALLACIGIALVMGGVFAFFNFRSIAKKEAKETAKSIAREVAEKEANKYIQNNLHKIINSYDFLKDDMDILGDDFDIDLDNGDEE